MPSPIKTCVLGTGLSGLTFHIPFVLALPNLFSLHAVLERSPHSEGGRVKQRFGVTTKIHRSFEEVLTDQEIELVIVGTPNATHFEYAKRCLEAGRHVLVEKPVCTTADEARQLENIASEKKLVLYAYQNRRWDSDFMALKSLLEQPTDSSSSLGDLVEFETHFDRYRMELKNTWKDANLPGAGQVYDLGTHLLDQVVSLFGRPASVTGFVENVRKMGDPDVPDTFTVILRYPRSSSHKYGLTAIVRGHILSVRDPQLRFLVRGTKGSFVKYGLDVQENQLRAMKSPSDMFTPGFGQEPDYIAGELFIMGADGKVTKERWPSTQPGLYVELFKNLAGAIRNGDELKVKWKEAITVLEVIEAINLSSKEGCTVSLV